VRESQQSIVSSLTSIVSISSIEWNLITKAHLGVQGVLSFLSYVVTKESIQTSTE
jgi:hypothetical protein